jgi:sulfur carrier protein
MKVLVNGEPANLTEGETVHGVVVALGRGPRGIAVAVNGEVVPRSRWEATMLNDDDRVEVLTAAQGG